MKPQKQCKKCPWRKDVDPNDIPGGYCVDKHKALEGTIAKEGDLTALKTGVLRMMACHESAPGKERACVGWVAHQAGPGNNIAVRLKILDGVIAPPRTVGEQHERFEDTLPKEAGS